MSKLTEAAASFYADRQPYKLRYSPPAQTDTVIIVFDTPQNWVAAGNVITATTGDKIYIPFGNAYTHGTATVVALPEGCTILSTSSTNGDVDNVLTKYIFCPPTVNSISDIPHTRDAKVYIVNVTATPIVASATAQAGGANTITLQAGSIAVNSAYLGMAITIISGTGAGQYRTISGYVGSTLVATVSSAWGEAPDATSVYSISNCYILIEGAGNLACYGGKYASGTEADPLNSGNRACIRPYNQKYSGFFEGLWIDANLTYGRDGIEFGSNGNAPSGASPAGTYCPDYYFQNCRFDNIFSQNRRGIKNSPAVDKVITNISIASQAVVTSIAHGYANGQVKQLSDMPTGFEDLEGLYVWVSSVTTDTFKIEDFAGDYIDTSTFTPAFTGTATSSNATQDNVHADILQPYGRARFIFIDRLTGYSQYQGLFFDPQAQAYDYLISNTNVGYLDYTGLSSVAGFAIYVRSDSDTSTIRHQYVDFYLDNVYAQKRDFFSLPFEGASIYPQSISPNGDYAATAEAYPETGYSDGIAEWPPILGVRGNVIRASIEGGAKFGDFVVGNKNCGASYVSPGYQTNGKPFWYETIDCKLWLTFIDFHVINTGDFGAIDVTDIQDMSYSDNHCEATNIKYLIDYHHARPTATFSGDGFIDTLLESFGDTDLFADGGDAFFVYAVMSASEDGCLFSKGSTQLKVYYEDGDLYGVCRGVETLIKANWDGSMAFIGVSWNGSSLVWYYNGARVSASAGSGSSQSVNFVFGAANGGNSEFLTGTMWAGRIYDRALTENEIYEIYSKENEKANLDGRQPERPTPPSAVQSFVLVGGIDDIDISFSAPVDDGGADILDYFYRYSVVGSGVWIDWQLSSTPSTTTSTNIPDLDLGDYIVEVYPINSVGYGTMVSGLVSVAMALLNPDTDEPLLNPDTGQPLTVPN